MTTLCVSKYHRWFRELGYEQLDIREYGNGEWEIIQYENTPIVPSLTRYQTVLGPIRNVLPTLGFVEKYTKQCDMNRAEFWAREEAKSRAVELEHAATQKHAEDHAERAAKAVTRNPDLMERISRKGIQEMDLSNISKHIPRSKL